MFEFDQVVCFDEPRPEMAFVGWACFDDRTPVSQVWLEADGIRTPCLMDFARPDVALMYEAPALARSGLLGRVAVTAAVTPVRLIGRRDGRDCELGVYRAEWRGKPLDAPVEPHDYAWWIRTCEKNLFWPLAELTARLRALERRPLFSIVLPTYDTRLYHLQRCIDSVTNQHYPDWELCITDDGSSQVAMREYLQARAARDPRVRVTFSAKNRGISHASNQSIGAARGDYIVLLDHDDEVHPHALTELAVCVNRHPDADLVYTDEDKIDQAGVRQQPAFKPDFDADLLRAFHYIGHLVAMRATLVRQVGGFRSDTDGAQDWDLILRVTSATDPARVHHVAKPLYHWRMHEESTALTLDAKPYAVRAWQRVLEHHLGPTPQGRVVQGLFLGSMRIVRPTPAETRIGVVYRARDGAHQSRALARCRIPAGTQFFESVLATVAPVGAPRRVVATTGDLQSDVLIVVSCPLDSVNHGFLQELAAQAMRDECGLVGATVVGVDSHTVTAGLACASDGTWLNPFAGLASHEFGYMGQARVVRRVAAVGPQVFAVRTSLLAAAGGVARLAEDSLEHLCEALVRQAHQSGRAVLHTPYAIATMRRIGRAYSPPYQPMAVAPALRLNPNVEAFSSVEAVLRTGVH